MKTTMLALGGRALLLLGVGALTGCSLPGGASAPTAYPPDYVPTAVYLTAAAIDSSTQTALPPTEAPSATPTLIPPTIGPTPSPTPGPPVPLAAIQVRAPGPMSKLVSPIHIQLIAAAGESHQLEVALLGEDGRMLGRTLTSIPADQEGEPISLKMPYEIRATGELGYIQVSRKGSHGRLQSLITVPILLLSSGESQINPPGDTVYERIALADLPPEASVSGGLLRVVGDMLPYSRQPMILELVRDDGRALSLRVLNVSGKGWQSFSTTLPFTVDQPTSALLFITEADDVLNGPAYVFSRPIILIP